MRTTPQLIAYADRLAGNLSGLLEVLDRPLARAFTGVHVLAFFDPIDGADAGFDPTDHTVVDERLGTWTDVAAIASSYDVMADLIVNHISDESAQFRDWVRHGSRSEYDGMFLTFDSVFPRGAGEHELTSVYRPRPGLPLTRVRLADDTVRLVWTTFTSHQIDIDVAHPTGWEYLIGIIDRLAAAGVSLVRLDAVGYAVKRSGTSCFMIPETLEFVLRLTTELHQRGMTVLVEVHGHHLMQIEIAELVDLVYDFALPPLLIDAFHHGDSGPLRHWLEIRPANAINVLDTHDGIGVIDVGADPTHPDRPGLLSPYYDALGCDDARYLLARMIQCLIPGIPQIYYVGLLAGSNDISELERTAVGRDVNRHRYGSGELDEALERPVVRSLLHFLRWRCACPVFDGSATVLDAPAHALRIRWDRPGAEIEAVEVTFDLAAATFSLVESGSTGTRTVTSIDDL